MDSWSKIEFIFTFKLGINPQVLRELEFYTIQYLLKEYEEHVDRENKEYDKQNKQMEKQQQAMKPGTSFGNFQVPKYEMPKFEMPKM